MCKIWQSTPPIDVKRDETRMRSAPQNVVQGYILAKAVRCVAYTNSGIHPTTNIEDVISSFIVKSFILDDIKGKLNKLQPCDVAIKIYQLLAEK